MKLIQTLKDNAIAITSIMLLAVVMLLIGGTYKYFMMNREIEDGKGMIAAITDTLSTVRMEDGRLKASITAFKADRAKSFLSIKTKDSSINWLQRVVRQYQKEIDRGGSAVVFSTNTKIDTTLPNTITGMDTVREEKTTMVYPIYTTPIHLGKWINGYTITGKDSSHIQLSTYNEYEAVIGQKGGWWWNSPPPTADIYTLSPYDSIRSARAYIKSYPKPKRIGFGGHIGYGIGIDGKVRPVASLGLNFNIYEW